MANGARASLYSKKMISDIGEIKTKMANALSRGLYANTRLNCSAYLYFDLKAFGCIFETIMALAII